MSFDGGETWTKADTAQADGGAYHATWTNPESAAGKDVDLRVTAADADGATFTQTVDAAYTVAAADE
ncbi:hypothetical protein NKH77_54830 [Streptomyces sp. M19]